MAGIREKKQARTQAEILRHAERLFAAKGFSGTSVEEIAAKAEVAVGTVYNYFHSKNDLLIALMQRDSEVLAHKGDRILAHPGDVPEEAVAALFRVYSSFLARYDKKLMRELWIAALSRPKELGRRMLRMDEQLLQQLARLLERLQVRNLVRKEIPITQAALVLYGSFSVLLMMYLNYEEMTVDHLRLRLRQSTILIFQDWDVRRPPEGLR